jgi:hypothetical protein
VKVNRTELLKRLKKCMPGIETGQTILEGADSFAFSDGLVHSFNDNMSVTVGVDDLLGKKMEGVLPAAEIMGLLGKLPEDEINLKVGPDTWVIVCGGVRAELNQPESKVLKYVDSLALDTLEFQKLPEGFFTALSTVFLGANRTNYDGVFVKDNKVYATDSHRLLTYELPEPVPMFWIDSQSQADLLKLGGLVDIAVSKRWVHFRDDTGTIVSVKRVSDTDLDGSLRYPVDNMENLISAGEKSMESDDALTGTFPPGIKDALDRAALFADPMSGSMRVDLQLDSDGIEIQAQRMSGRIQERIPWPKETKINGSVSVSVSDAMLRSIITKAPEFVIVKDLRVPVYLHSGPFRAVIAKINPKKEGD